MNDTKFVFSVLSSMLKSWTYPLWMPVAAVCYLVYDDYSKVSDYVYLRRYRRYK